MSIFIIGSMLLCLGVGFVFGVIIGMESNHDYLKDQNEILIKLLKRTKNIVYNWEPKSNSQSEWKNEWLRLVTTFSNTKEK
jgi:hypothetical protein